MKKVITITLIAAFLFLSVLMHGCGQTGNAVKDKNLTLEEATELAMNRIYELTENKQIIDDNGMSLYNSTYEGDKDRWFLTIKVSHTLIKAYVYNNETIKIVPYKVTY